MAKLKLVKKQTLVDRDSVVRLHARLTGYAGLGFLVTAAATVPFLAGNALHEHWRTLGVPMTTICLLFFVVFVFEAGFTWVLWSTVKEIKAIEDRSPSSRR
jgi:apolipoprotein N-acyltransferase